MHQPLTTTPALSGLAHWSAALAANNAGYLCEPLRRGRRVLPEWRYSVVRFGLPPWKHPRHSPDETFFAPGVPAATLPLPKWGDAAVRFAQLPPWKYPRRGPAICVSDASVVRARARADQAVRPPAEVKPVWQAPAEEPVAFEDLFLWVLNDAELADLDRLDKTVIPKELRRMRSIPSRQRVYTAEEKYIIEVGISGQFSNDKRVELEPPGAETRDERHQYDMYPFLTEQVGEIKLDRKIRQLTLQEVASALPVMTTLANLLLRAANKDVRKIIDAKTVVAQTYQASELILRQYRFGLRDRVIPDGMLRAARVVYHTVSLDLLARDYENRIALAGKGRLSTAPDLLDVVRFMLIPGKSSYDAAIKFDRDASSLRERLNNSLDIIEAKYGRFCKDLGLPPQTRVRAGDNSNRNRDLAAPADHPPEDRAAEVSKYLGNAARLNSYLIDPRDARTRKAYLAIAEYLTRGGFICRGGTAYGVAPGLFDGRSNKQVLRDAGVVERDERRFPPAKAKRPRPNTEYGIYEGLRHGLAGDAASAVENDDAPISDTRKSEGNLYLRDLSLFFPHTSTVPNHED